MNEELNIFFISAIIATLSIIFLAAIFLFAPSEDLETIINNFRAKKNDVKTLKAELKFNNEAITGSKTSKISGEGLLIQKGNNSKVDLNLTQESTQNTRSISIFNISDTNYLCAGPPKNRDEWLCKLNEKPSYTERLSNRISLNEILEEYDNYFELVDLSGNVLETRKIGERKCTDVFIHIKPEEVSQLRNKYVFEPFIRHKVKIEINSTLCLDEETGIPLKTDLWVIEMEEDIETRKTHIYTEIRELETNLSIENSEFELPTETTDYEMVK